MTLCKIRFCKRLHTKKLRFASVEDGLEQKLEKEYSRANRYNLHFCIAIIDVDNFKQINDQFGHMRGDRVLLQLARLMRRQARDADVLARYGGDEFVLLMPETKVDDAMIALERLRSAAEAITTASSEPFTISCGLAQWSPESRQNLKDIFAGADAALYEAKHTGRNRVIVGDAVHTA